MSDGRRALLRGIAFSPDPNVTARDRLEALARLDQLGADDFADLGPEIRGLDDETVDRELDADCGAEIVAAAVRGDDDRWPVMTTEIRRAVEERARELSDRDGIEREIAARVETEVSTRLQWYLAREVQMAADADKPEEHGDDSGPEPAAPPPIPDGIRLDLGWRPDRRRRL